MTVCHEVELIVCVWQRVVVMKWGERLMTVTTRVSVSVNKVSLEEHATAALQGSTATQNASVRLLSLSYYLLYVVTD